MDGVRRSGRRPSPRLHVAGGMVCIGIAAAMSMTFVEAEWQNLRSVAVVLAIMAAGGIGGVFLLVRGLVRMRVQSLLDELVLITPGEDLALGEPLRHGLELKAIALVEVERVVLECEVVETCLEDEGMAPHQHTLVDLRQEHLVGDSLTPGETRLIEGSFSLPADLPATFRTEHQSVDCWVRARVQGPELGDVQERWLVPIAPRQSHGALEPALVPAEAGDPDLAAVYTTEVEGTRITVELPGVGTRDGVYVLRAGETVKGTLLCEPSAGAGDLPELRVALLFLTDGGQPDTVPVGEAVAPTGDGRRLEFELPVPRGPAHSFRGPLVQVGWGLRVSSRVLPDGAAVEYFPVEVLPATSSDPAEGATAGGA